MSSNYLFIFSLFPKVLEEFNPDCVVVQCGADCLSGDPLGGFNLSLNGLGHCVTEILQTELPGLFLGGGGYNPPNAARYELDHLQERRSIPVIL